MDEVVKIHSVSFRLQRRTTEVAFVSVLVTPDLLIRQPDGTGRIHVDKMVQRAREMGYAADIAWQPEAQEVLLHHIQIPPPESATDEPA